MTTNFVGTLDRSALPLDMLGRDDGGAALLLRDVRKAFVAYDALQSARVATDDVVALREPSKEAPLDALIGTSRALRAVRQLIDKVADTDATVLVTGETGTGKELIARAIHRRSYRARRPFVAVNCAALPRELIAAELFGHERGAFTGALQRRAGRFEQVANGTLFLDEIGEVPVETQIALLRVLQEREFERVGSNRPMRCDARIVAATNRDLEAAIAAGTFRSDLFYRLNVFPIALPALRQRRDDIPLLVEHFVRRSAAESGRRISALSKRSLDALRAYDWPGNIRELQNVVERSMILCDGEVFTVDEGWLQRNVASSFAAAGVEPERRRAS